jgi:hypothetical protein
VCCALTLAYRSNRRAWLAARASTCAYGAGDGMHGMSMAWFGGGGVVRTGLFYAQIDFWGIRLPALTSQEGVMCGCVVCGFLPFHGTRMKSQQPRAEQWGIIRPGPAPWCVVVLHAMNAPKRRLRRSLWVRETNQKCVTHFFSSSE